MKYVFGTIIAVACGVSLAAQSPTRTPAGHSSRTSQPPSVTVTGCLVASPQGSATAAQPGQPGGFMLTGVAQNGAVSPQSTSVASSYALSGGNPSDLRTYSNTRVEIQGRIQPAGTTAGQTGTAGVTPTTPPAGTPPTATLPASTPPTAPPPAGPPPTSPSPTGTTGTGTGIPTASTGQVPMQQLQITSVRQVPGICGGGQ